MKHVTFNDEKRRIDTRHIEHSSDGAFPADRSRNVALSLREIKEVHCVFKR